MAFIILLCTLVVQSLSHSLFIDIFFFSGVYFSFPFLFISKAVYQHTCYKYLFIPYSCQAHTLRVPCFDSLCRTRGMIRMGGFMYRVGESPSHGPVIMDMDMVIIHVMEGRALLDKAKDYFCVTFKSTTGQAKNMRNLKNALGLVIQYLSL